MLRHPKSERFHEILAELGELHDKKQRDYGTPDDPFANITASAEWGISPCLGALLRLNDKVNRLKSWQRTGTLANEGAEDSMRDIAVYAIIALIENERAQTNFNKTMLENAIKQNDPLPTEGEGLHIRIQPLTSANERLVPRQQAPTLT